MINLKPNGVNHLALSTTDMKRQLSFWCDALGLPLKALFWMHGVEGAYHGFIELSPGCYISFVQHPENSDEIEFGVSHSDGGAGHVRGGTMQHLALHVDEFDDLLAMRDRLRSKAIQVLGPLDHGFTQSIYFEGPEGLNLEISCGTEIDERAWIDPEVTALCGIDADELAAMISPPGYDRPAEPVPQPTQAHPDNIRAERNPEGYAQIAALPDDFIWERLSITDPPVKVDSPTE